MRKINTIWIHCTAGFKGLEAMRKFWKDKLGWRSDGYHIIVNMDGCWEVSWPLEKPSNGVKGHNGDGIHISYIGGVNPANPKEAMDTRTEKQKQGIIEAIEYVLDYLESKGQDTEHINIKGHRDASPDQNGDGIISSWERIKECPSFDAIPEYENLRVA